MAGGFPHTRVHNNRAIQADHVIAGANHVVPPGVFDVAFEFDAERAVIPKSADTAIDFARRKDESSALAQRHQLFHIKRTHNRWYPLQKPMGLKADLCEPVATPCQLIINACRNSDHIGLNDTPWIGNDLS